MLIKSFSTKDTVKLGERFSKILKEQDIVILEGSLGGGKTTFIKGILKGFGFKKKVLSPSFTLIRQYKKKNLTIYHIDLYRLNKRDILNLGIDDFLYSPKSIILIEWGNKIKDMLFKYIKITFDFLGENVRIISFASVGYDFKKLNFKN